MEKSFKMDKKDNYKEYLASLPESSDEPNEETIEALREAKERNYTGRKRVDTNSMENFLKSCDE